MITWSRRTFLQASLTTASSSLLAGCGLPLLPWQQTARIPRIGWLSPDAPPQPTESAFVQGLRDLGYVAGQQIEIVYRWAEGREERLPELAAELVRLPVDVILAVGAVGGLAAKGATGTIPIVGASNDPVEAGLAVSLAQPGGNYTGLSLATPKIGAKRVQLLKEAVPSIVRIAALGYAASATLEQDWNAAQVGAQALGLDLARYDVDSANNFPAAFAAMATWGADALLTLQNRFFSQNTQRLLTLLAQYGLPAMGDSVLTNAGGLLSYMADSVDLYRRSATYIDKILKGAKPGDLPIEEPTRFDFIINLKTAHSLGLTIPQSVLQQATAVIP